MNRSFIILFQADVHLADFSCSIFFHYIQLQLFALTPPYLFLLNTICVHTSLHIFLMKNEFENKKIS